jgi:hypothetical protein
MNMHKLIEAEREMRQFNRYVFGPFRWRYHLDRLCGTVLKWLGRSVE